VSYDVLETMFAEGQLSFSF